VAAIVYGPVEDVDLSGPESLEVKEGWEFLAGSAKMNLRRFAREMRLGDRLYVKEGGQIVGEGEVIGPYVFNPKTNIMAEDGLRFTHQRQVAWRARFKPVEVLLGAELHTVLQIEGERWDRLKARLKSRGEAVAGGTSSMHAAAQLTEVEEGKLVEAVRRFRQRNQKIIAQKWEKAGEHPACEACGFRFRERYGNDFPELLEAHHRNPLSENETTTVTKTSDLALLCPNCHRASHSRKPPIGLAALKKLVGRLT
jgi:hypothetical protein